MVCISQYKFPQGWVGATDTPIYIDIYIDISIILYIPVKLDYVIHFSVIHNSQKMEI